MPFVPAECDPREISFFHHDRAFRRYDPLRTATQSVYPGLGVLSCQGVTDEDTVITGRICQLDTTVSVDIKVAVDYDRIENSSRSGRALTIRFPDDGLIELDASPVVAERGQDRGRHDHVLAALAR